MNIVIDGPIITAVASAIAAGIAILAFWMKFSDAIIRARNKAEQAEKDAIEAQTICNQLETRVLALAAEFGIYRERVATDYVSKDTMREIKQELVDAIDKIGDKLDQVLSYERNL